MGTTNFIRNGFIKTIGNTPLMEIPTLSALTKCRILAKAEFLNPGGSVKDRAAWSMVRQAEKAGKLVPHAENNKVSPFTVVEGTAGNTGIGLAHVCNARGYKCVIYMPNTQSAEKIELLRVLGADVRPVPAVPLADPMNYNHQAKAFADETDGAVWMNQFDNTDNKLAHYETTGPEIWTGTNGTLDAFVCATGTGGTYAGTTQYLKEQNDAVKCFVADPPGSVLYKYFTEGKLERTGDGSITEGIGQGRVTENMKDCVVDGALHIEDERSIKMVYHLLHHEGIFVGASSALNIVAAVEAATRLGPGHTVVSMLCDGAARYQSRLFSKSWLESKDLFNAIPPESRHLASLP